LALKLNSTAQLATSAILTVATTMKLPPLLKKQDIQQQQQLTVVAQNLITIY